MFYGSCIKETTVRNRKMFLCYYIKVGNLTRVDAISIEISSVGEFSMSSKSQESKDFNKVIRQNIKLVS